MTTTPEKKPSNRRRSQRARARESVKIECRKGASGFGPNLTVKALDLSDTGVRLIIKEALAVMDETEILITAYGIAKPIKRLGNVRWVVSLEDQQFGVGIEFQKSLVYRDWQNLISLT